MKVKKFHQFIYIEKGPANSILIDFLTGNIFHIENKTIEKFESGRFEEIPDFIEAITKEELIIETDVQRWIPTVKFKKELDDDKDDTSFSLEIEEGCPLDEVIKKFKDAAIFNVHFFGKEKPDELFPGVEIILKEKNFSDCMEMIKIDGEFEQIDRDTYQFNKIFNSCWGKKIAITKDGKIRPCIYSEIIIGDIIEQSLNEILAKISFYWTLNKDKIEKCKICEFRYACFDCREIAYREGGNLQAANPYCSYNPEKGEFE
jgi:radical SAM protein with 4Fe4S-binding SPASM domain